jgi:hypothetical protein
VVLVLPGLLLGLGNDNPSFLPSLPRFLVAGDQFSQIWEKINKQQWQNSQQAAREEAENGLLQ